jgi:superfamily II helicase
MTQRRYLLIEPILGGKCTHRADKLDAIEEVQSKCLGANQNAGKVLEKLQEFGFVKIKKPIVKVTPYGRAVSMSFLLPKEAAFIRENLGKKEARWIAVKLLPSTPPFPPGPCTKPSTLFPR